MGIVDKFTKRQAQDGFNSGEFAYMIDGPRKGDRVEVVSLHDQFSEAAGEPVYIVQYEDGMSGQALLSELAKKPPEPVQQEMTWES